jgi:crotonobetainyl-CoA:carnitine CoA-transferase CaiB-like acyl-CoA transferase
LKPSLVYCSVTGFGQDGPRRDQAAYDFMIQAMCGLMSLTGERDGAPQKVGVPIIDLMTGMYAAVAVLAALARRAETGQGETIDLAMLDVGAGILANQAMNWLVGGRVPKRAGNRHPNIQPQDVFPASDGEIVLAVGNDGQFAKLCEAIGRPDLAADPRFIRNADRVRHEAELTPLLAARFRDFTRAELTARLDAAGVPCGPINSVPDVFADPQLVHRGLLRRLPHPHGEVPTVGSPIRMAEAGTAGDRAPPTLGQHTAEVLEGIGIGEAERAALAAEGVI